MKRKVVLGFLGSNLDSGVTEKRWERWRPTVSLCAREDFVVDRIELLYSKDAHLELARQVTTDVAQISPGTSVVSHFLQLDDPWDFPKVYAALHEFARSYDFRDDCDYYVHLTTGTHIAQICLFLLTEARYFPARLIDTSLDKRSEIKWHGKIDIIDLDLSKYDLLASRFLKEKVDSETLLKSGIVTKNARFNKLITDIEKVCLRSSAPMLLTGPTGAGKSQLAQRIYELRLRRHLVDGPFVEVNCATIRGDNAHSALFGHKKGAYTGAVADRPGHLMAANNGILFLDEIALLGHDEQAMLLRALEKKRFFPLGSDKEVTSNFQLIAGTNCDLAKEVARGTFRADLYARINQWQFKLPGLADRPEDIEPNVDYELEKAGSELNCHVSFNQAARVSYLEFASSASWPGNFRDLAASIMRMATLADGGRITTDDVHREIDCLKMTWGVTPSEASDAVGKLTAKVLNGQALDEFEAAQFEAVLEAIAETKNMAEAGRRLFAESRRLKKSSNDSDRVRKYLERWDLKYDEVKQTLARS